jgi:hypothetical protein
MPELTADDIAAGLRPFFDQPAPPNVNLIPVDDDPFGVKPQSYSTDLGSQEPAFRQWVVQNKVPFDPDAKTPQDYDMRGFWRGLQSGDPKAASAVDPNDNRLHYPDYWKTPFHETFSSESKWAMPDTPSWNDKDQLVAKDGSVIYDDRAPKPLTLTPVDHDPFARQLVPVDHNPFTQ